MTDRLISERALYEAVDNYPGDTIRKYAFYNQIMNKVPDATLAQSQVQDERVLKKPPLGIMPREIFEKKCKADRVRDIVGAILRYSDANAPIPRSWIRELLSLIRVEDGLDD